MKMRIKLVYLIVGICFLFSIAVMHCGSRTVVAAVGNAADRQETVAAVENAADRQKTVAAVGNAADRQRTYETTSEEQSSEEQLSVCLHEYKTVVTAATNKANGYKEEICRICGDRKNRTDIYRLKSVKLDKTSYIYDGKTKKPGVTAYDSKGNVISSANYEVKYQKGRKNPGRYSVVLKFKGDYSGTVTRYFTIILERPSISEISGGQGAFTITPKVSYRKFTGYQIQYSKTKNFSEAVTRNLKTGKTSYKISNLDTDMRYYVRIRTYQVTDGKRIYSKWSKRVAVRTKRYSNMNIVSTNHQKYSYDEMVNDISKLQKRYKDHMKVNIIGTTADNRNLYEIIIGNPDADKHLIVLSNLHAREYMTIQLCMKQIEYYLNNYNDYIDGIKVSEVLDNVAIHYVPSCNPDGTAISQFGFEAIRNTKLRNRLYNMGGLAYKWKSNARGVDLNQNWDIDFEVHGTKGSDGYSGKKPESESEVKAIVRMLDRIEKNGEIVGLISYHAMGEVIYGRCAPEAGDAMEKAVNDMYNVAYQQSGYILYGGTDISCNQSREYFMYKRNIPGITIEIGSSETPLDISQFAPTWRKNKNLVFLEAALFD
ncbi:MAG: M14 family zinc carboxypeptidase [Coprococcus sp.]